MKYEKIVEGKFLARPNRFVAQVDVSGEPTLCHVKNTGRCKELLVPGAKVYLEDFANHMGKRKMRYSLVAVEKGELLINMDSQAPNKVCEEALRDGTLKLPGMANFSLIQREKTFGQSRFDFYLEDENGQKMWMEVKGVTLEENGIVKFPDAPTERGVKHVHHLQQALKEGYSGAIVFVIQMNEAKCFSPNDVTHPEFGCALREAKADGVHVLAYTCNVSADRLSIKKNVPVLL